MFAKFTIYIKESLSSFFWTIKLFWKTTPLFTLLALLTNIFSELLQIVSTFTFAKVLDILITTSESDIKGIVFMIGLMASVSLFIEANNLIMNYSNRMISETFYPKYQQLMYLKLSRMRIADLENPETNNLIDRARRDSQRLEGQFYSAVYVVSVFVGMLSSGMIIANFSTYFVPLFMVTLLPAILIDRKYMAILWKFRRDTTEQSRLAYDASYVLTDSRSLQEIRITSGVKYISAKFEKFFDGYIKKYMKIRSSWYKNSYLFYFLRVAVESYAAFLAFSRYLVRAISIGDVTFYIRQVNNFAGSMNSFVNTFNSIYENSLSIRDIQKLFSMPEESAGVERMDKLKEGPEIKFRNISFKYPNTEINTIKNLNLEIKSGEKVAIVGHNGAGKTTLIKLLLKFYDLENGEIIINNKSLADLNIKDYYKNTSVLFQDFNTYSFLTVEQNILVGKANKKTSKIKLRQAAQMADVDDFVHEYKGGYNQLLSEKYEGGIRPSTGQWQKIAIARFFYRNSPLIIFDEPTAAIDAVAEAKIFNKIYNFFKNKTVIIISHRFSTVRNADRIIVLDKGRIIEQGSHEELIKINGKYANAFKLQAEGYK